MHSYATIMQINVYQSESRVKVRQSSDFLLRIDNVSDHEEVPLPLYQRADFLPDGSYRAQDNWKELHRPAFDRGRQIHVCRAGVHRHGTAQKSGWRN